MKFVEFAPYASNNTMSFRPNLPSAWADMTFSGIKMRVAPANIEHRVNLAVRRLADGAEHQFTNVTGNTLGLNTTHCVFPPTAPSLASPSTAAPPTTPTTVRSAPFWSPISPPRLAPMPSRSSRPSLAARQTVNADASVDFFDYLDFVAAFSSNDCAADFNTDGTIDFFDYLDFVAAFSSPC